MLTPRQMVDRALAYASHEGWTQEELARRAGISRFTFRNRNRPTWQPAWETASKLHGVVPEDFKAEAAE